MNVLYYYRCDYENKRVTIACAVLGAILTLVIICVICWQRNRMTKELHRVARQTSLRRGRREALVPKPSKFICRLIKALEAIAHYTQNCKKFSYFPFTLQFFFTTATIVFNSFICSQRFSQRFFLEKSCSLVCSVQGPLQPETAMTFLVHV